MVIYQLFKQIRIVMFQMTKQTNFNSLSKDYFNAKHNWQHSVAFLKSGFRTLVQNTSVYQPSYTLIWAAETSVQKLVVSISVFCWDFWAPGIELRPILPNLDPNFQICSALVPRLVPNPLHLHIFFFRGGGEGGNFRRCWVTFATRS